MPGFSVLVVCTANLCRSPAAAALLTAALPGGSAVSVRSAGTRAALGDPVPPRMVRALARRGGDVSGHVPRQLTAEMVAAADLVLVATRAHRATVVGAVPGSVGRTFTLPEMARLLSAVPPPRWRAPGEEGAAGGASADDEVSRWAALAGRAAQGRGAGPGAGEDDDLADPYRRSSRAHRASVQEIGRATSTVLDAAGALSPRGR